MLLLLVAPLGQAESRGKALDTVTASVLTGGSDEMLWEFASFSCNKCRMHISGYASAARIARCLFILHISSSLQIIVPRNKFKHSESLCKYDGLRKQGEG